MIGWKTTSAGILAIAGSVIAFYFAMKNSTLTPEIIMTCIGGVLTGIGLLFAKDSNVTGGTIDNKQVVVPEDKK
jgi:hypothetical protein